MTVVMLQSAAAVRRTGRTLHELLLLLYCLFPTMTLAGFWGLHLLTRHQVQELDSQDLSYKQKDNEEERSKYHQGKTLAWQSTCWYSLTFILKVGVKSIFGSTSSFPVPHFLSAEARQVQEKDELPAAGRCSFVSDACCLLPGRLECTTYNPITKSRILALLCLPWGDH